MRVTFFFSLSLFRIRTLFRLIWIFNFYDDFHHMILHINSTNMIIRNDNNVLKNKVSPRTAAIRPGGDTHSPIVPNTHTHTWFTGAQSLHCKPAVISCDGDVHINQLSKSPVQPVLRKIFWPIVGFSLHTKRSWTMDPWTFIMLRLQRLLF